MRENGSIFMDPPPAVRRLCQKAVLYSCSQQVGRSDGYYTPGYRPGDRRGPRPGGGAAAEEELSRATGRYSIATVYARDLTQGAEAVAHTCIGAEGGGGGAVWCGRTRQTEGGDGKGRQRETSVSRCTVVVLGVA